MVGDLAQVHAQSEVRGKAVAFASGIGIGGGYVLAISAHLLFEGNRPMIAVNPVWGAAADLRMTWLAATGRLRSELDRHQIGTASRGPGFGSR